MSCISSSSVSTSEVTAVGTSILQIKATDADIGSNAQLTYKLISGDEIGEFSSQIRNDLSSFIYCTVESSVCPGFVLFCKECLYSRSQMQCSV